LGPSDHEDGEGIVPRNADIHLQDCTVLQPWRTQSEEFLPWQNDNLYWSGWFIIPDQNKLL